MDRNDSPLFGHDSRCVDFDAGGFRMATRPICLGLAHTQLGVGVCARRLWCFDCHHETVSRHCQLAFDGWHVAVGTVVGAIAASAPCAVGRIPYPFA